MKRNFSRLQAQRLQKKRTLRVEFLEQRSLMAADLSESWVSSEPLENELSDETVAWSTTEETERTAEDDSEFTSEELAYSSGLNTFADDEAEAAFELPPEIARYFDLDEVDLTPVELDFATLTDPEPSHVGFDGVTAPRHNEVNGLDVDASGSINGLDALLIANHVLVADPSLTPAGELSAPGVFYTDVNGDGVVNEADFRIVLGVLDTSGGESAGGVNALPIGANPVSLVEQNSLFLTAAEVEVLLARAAGATISEDAIIVVVDRGGRILGVRVENGVLANITDMDIMTFAIDGALAKARTAAFFANDAAPLTSRTIRSLSETTITEREVESNPTIPAAMAGQNPFDTIAPIDPLALTYGPGFVAPIGKGGHFPPGINATPPVDLFGIERQSRDSLLLPGLNGIKENGLGDDIVLLERFNAPAGNLLPDAPESYGVISGMNANATGRGIGTMPGGLPLYKFVDTNADNKPDKAFLAGGIGVFFPGTDGYATFEQGFIPNVNQSSITRLNSKKALEAEYMAFAAMGGSGVFTPGGLFNPAPSPADAKSKNFIPIKNIAGIAPLTTVGFPFAGTGRIDLVGLTLEIIGPKPTRANTDPGPVTVVKYGKSLGVGNPNSGQNFAVNPIMDLFIDGEMVAGDMIDPMALDQRGVYLVQPRAAIDGTLTAAEVEQIVERSIAESQRTRAAIRLVAPVMNGMLNPAGTPKPGAAAKMVISVADKDGNLLAVYRMRDATIFSIDVSVAKARNTAYYADAAAIQNADLVDDDLLIANGTVNAALLNRSKFGNDNGVLGDPDLYTNVTSNVEYAPDKGLDFTNRTFRFLAEPRYPSGVDGTLPPVFSILNDPGINDMTAENNDQNNPTPAGLFQTVMGFDSFNVSRNFRDLDPDSLPNQNGIVFFPGSTALYKGGQLTGGFGISGDGVDQDDVVTFAGAQGFMPAQNLRADMVFYRGVRLPFQKFNRNPRGGSPLAQ